MNDDVGWRQTDTTEGPLFHHVPPWRDSRPAPTFHESIDGFAGRVNDKNRWHRTSASMHDAGHQFPTGCVFKESFPNCTIPAVSRQRNNAASWLPMPYRQRCEHA